MQRGVSLNLRCLSCEDCGSDKFASAGSNACTSCGPGRFSVQASANCTACSAGVPRPSMPLPANPVDLASSRQRLLQPAPHALAGSMPTRQAKAERSAGPGSLLCSMPEPLTAKFVVAASLRRLALLPAPAAAQVDSPFKPVQIAPPAARGVSQPPMPLPAKPVI